MALPWQITPIDVVEAAGILFAIALGLRAEVRDRRASRASAATARYELDELIAAGIRFPLKKPDDATPENLERARPALFELLEIVERIAPAFIAALPERMWWLRNLRDEIEELLESKARIDNVGQMSALAQVAKVYYSLEAIGFMATTRDPSDVGPYGDKDLNELKRRAKGFAEASQDIFLFMFGRRPSVTTTVQWLARTEPLT